jgi:hypothetical protein
MQMERFCFFRFDESIRMIYVVLLVNHISQFAPAGFPDTIRRATVEENLSPLVNALAYGDS